MKQLSISAKRARLYVAECRKARDAGRGEVPICNICDMPIAAGTGWHESHIPVAKALGGQRTGCAHVVCNLRHAALVVTPAVAKVKRVRNRHLGIVRPGLGRARFPCGKGSRLMKQVNGRVVPRETQLDKLRRTLAARRIGF